MTTEQYILTTHNSPIIERFDNFEDAFEAAECAGGRTIIKAVAADGFTAVALYLVSEDKTGKTVVRMKRDTNHGVQSDDKATTAPSIRTQVYDAAYAAAEAKRRKEGEKKGCA